MTPFARAALLAAALLPAAAALADVNSIQAGRRDAPPN
jgi:hypothetical protein